MDDLSDFVNTKLFPYLKQFETDADSANTIEYKTLKQVYQIAA